MFELLLLLLFGEFIVGAFAVVLVGVVFSAIPSLIDVPIDSISMYFNLVIKYFWPAFVVGGFLTLVTGKKSAALKVVVVWVLILVLFCFIPGNVTLPDAADVDVINVTYAHDFYRVDNTVNYKYSGYAIKDPDLITQITEMVDGAKYAFSHEELLTRGWWNYDRVFLEFLDADGKTLKHLTLIRDKGIQVDGWIDRFYRIKDGTGFDAQWFYDLAHNGK